jgi:hypothetical protein
MPNRLRCFEPGKVWFSTSNVVNRQFLFTPRLLHLSRRERRALIRAGEVPEADVEIRRIIGACLGRALVHYPIDVYAIIVLANHLHLLHGGDSTNISQFFAIFLHLVATEVNRHLGRKGKVFERRFQPAPCLDDEAVLKMFTYVHANPCNANLTDRAADWPGLSSARAVVSGEPLTFWYHDRTAYSQARHRGEQVTLDDFRREVTVTFAPLPLWADLPAEEQRRRAAVVIAEGERRAREERAAEGKTVMPLERLLSVDPFDAPKTPRVSSPRPLCHATDQVTFLAYREEYWAFCATFHEASLAFRSGNRSAVFPPHGIPPSLLWVAVG